MSTFRAEQLIEMLSIEKNTTMSQHGLIPKISTTTGTWDTIIPTGTDHSGTSLTGCDNIRPNHFSNTSNKIN